MIMLDNILPLVKKPIRYTGGEYNITVKAEPTVWVGVVFPDIYEIGMSNLGLKIVYHLFNQVPEIQCERIFAAWPDFGEKLQSQGLPLYGLETRKPCADFDLLGFSLQSELNYTNVLYVLDLAKIPRRSEERDGRHPILIAGGPAVLNPRPLSPVFDAFVIGDGEDVVPEIAQVLKEIPKNKKDARLDALALLSGIWVPSRHDKNHTVKKRISAALTEAGQPAPQILPICDVTHDRLTIEAMRGCTWGCRFCQSGYANRPLRIRPAAEIMRAVEKGIRETGWEEVSLLSFSILDYPDLPNLLRKLNEMLKKKNVSISLPAMRGELFTEELALLIKEVKKSGLTFAPETASEHLRRRLNKEFSNEKLIASIATAYQHGWKQVKLYFMIGLPFETDADVAEIGNLIQEITKACPRGGINMSLSPFVPKPHTPFEAVAFPEIDELRDKINRIRKIRKPRVELKYQDPEVSFIEAFLSRGDERIFPVIEDVYRQGGHFEEWREGFGFERWRTALDRTGIDPRSYLRPQERYPWDFVDIGVKKEFLKAEFERARNAQLTPNCYYDQCPECGICETPMARRPAPDEKYVGYGRFPKRQSAPSLYRVKYSIGEPFRYASHLDVTRTIYRALRRSDLPIQFTQGYSPIPKVSFCPPKSVGQTAKGDFFDLYLEGDYFGNISRELNSRFPSGIRILEVRSLAGNTPSLSTSINLVYYEVTLPIPEIVKPVDLPALAAASVNTKSGAKNLAESLDSISPGDGTLACGLNFGPGRINIYDLLAYLTGRPQESVRAYKVTRTSMFIKKEGILLSPMEVK
jgi:radical SAM family uncharacterized protein/radical SAM-linked protein